MNDSTNSSELSAMKCQLFTLLVALVIVSGTLTVYLFDQARSEHKTIVAMEPQAAQLVQGFNQNRATIDNFVKQVVAYGEMHPDFRAVLAKNGIVLSTNAPTK